MIDKKQHLMTYKEAFEALRAEIFKRMNNLCCNGVVANSDKDKYLLLQDLFGYVVSLPVEDGSPSAGKSAGDVFGKEPLQATLDYLEEAKKHYATPDGLTKCQAWVRGLAKKSEAEASDDLDDAAYYFAMDEYGNPKESGFLFNQRCFKAGADWQLRRMTENALDGEVGSVAGREKPLYIRISGEPPQDGVVTEGDKVRVILIFDKRR